MSQTPSSRSFTFVSPSAFNWLRIFRWEQTLLDSFFSIAFDFLVDNIFSVFLGQNQQLATQRCARQRCSRPNLYHSFSLMEMIITDPNSWCDKPFGERCFGTEGQIWFHQWAYFYQRNRNRKSFFLRLKKASQKWGTERWICRAPIFAR